MKSERKEVVLKVMSGNFGKEQYGALPYLREGYIEQLKGQVEEGKDVGYDTGYEDCRVKHGIPSSPATGNSDSKGNLTHGTLIKQERISFLNGKGYV